MNMQAFNSRPEVTEQIAQSVQTVLQQIGEDPTREGLVKTPKRVGEALQFLCKGYNEDFLHFPFSSHPLSLFPGSGDLNGGQATQLLCRACCPAAAPACHCGHHSSCLGRKGLHRGTVTSWGNLLEVLLTLRFE